MLKGKISRVGLLVSALVALCAVPGFCEDPVAPASLGALLGTMQTTASSNVLLVAGVVSVVFLTALGITIAFRMVRKYAKPS